MSSSLLFSIVFSNISRNSTRKEDQVVWLSNIVANVQLYFKLKGYKFPHVETEELCVGKYTFIITKGKNYCTLCLK